MKKLARNKGFTLIEILVVIGIIAILATIVLIAINPARQFAQARITQRQSNVETILNAIGQRLADNKGVFAGTFGGNICGPLPTGAAAAVTTDMAADTTTKTGKLGCLVPTYVPALPNDPTWVSGVDTLYTVVSDSTTGRVTVCSSLPAEPTVTGSVQVCIAR